MLIWFNSVQEEYKIGDQQSYLSDSNLVGGSNKLVILYELNKTVMPLADKIIQQLEGPKVLGSA